jgi:malonyl-CoA O-methyltransferase
MAMTVLDPVRVAALRETAGTLAQRARGAAHPRWRTLLADTWGLPRLPSPRRGGLVWLVCPAGGELVQTWSLVPALRQALPGATLVLSTSGHAFLDVALRVRGADARLYTPWDLPGPVRRALAAVRPDLVVAVEAAWQPELLAQARRRGACTMLASGAMAADYHQAEPYARAMRRGVLGHLDLVGAKSEEDAAAFAALGVPPARLRVLGDLRADPAFHVVPAAERQALRRRLGLGEGDRVLVAGSVHRGEDEAVLEAVRLLREGGLPVRLVLAPRYLADVARVEDGARARSLTVARFTRPGDARADVVVLDTYGDLPRAYAVATWIFLGGSLVRIGLGLGQNLVEPLAQGAPVFFGPHMRRWTAITRELTSIFPGLAIRGAGDLAAGIRALEPHGPTAAALAVYASAYLARGADSVARHVEAVRELMPGPGAHAAVATPAARASRGAAATGRLGAAVRRLVNGRAPAGRPALDIHRHARAALRWLEDNRVPGAGIRVHAGAREAYPEVTGYLIPTLLAWGRHGQAVDLARWLVATQNADGSWSDPSGRAPYTFDTAQVLKGLIAIAPRLPEVDEAVRRGCQWLLSQVEATGRVGTPDTSAWQLPGGRRVDDRIHLDALQPLRAAARRFDEPRYDEAVERALKHYLDDPRLTRFDTLSHFHAYVLEALVDLGRSDLAAEAMQEVERRQRRDGAVPAYPDVRWVCAVGLAQYVAVWYRLGMPRPADRGLAHLCRRQRRSGGFRGSHGAGARYFPDTEISWAAKYFLDACALHVRAAFDAEVAAFPDAIADTDGRVRAILDGLGEHAAGRVLDAGCGKGRFSRVLAARYPSADLRGVDLSEAMLRHAPAVMQTTAATLLDLPFPEASFDAVFSVEALEHALDPEVAVDELCRVLRPGGRIVIVDKSLARRGALRVEPWERWFHAGEVSAWLGRHCDGVEAVPIAHGPAREPDGLFLAWRGRRRAGAPRP